MGRPATKQKIHAKTARMRNARAEKRCKARATVQISSELESGLDEDQSDDVCTWSGGVNNEVVNEDEPGMLHFEEDEELIVDELEVEEIDMATYLTQVVQTIEQRDNEMRWLDVQVFQAVENALKPSAYRTVAQPSTSAKADARKWKRADAKLRTGYQTGNAERTVRRNAAKQRMQEEKDAKTRAG